MKPFFLYIIIIGLSCVKMGDEPTFPNKFYLTGFIIKKKKVKFVCKRTY